VYLLPLWSFYIFLREGIYFVFIVDASWCCIVYWWYTYPTHCFYKLDEFYCMNGWYVFHLALGFCCGYIWLCSVIVLCIFYIVWFDLFQWLVGTSVLILTHSISNGLWTSFWTCNWIYLNIINIDIDIDIQRLDCWLCILQLMLM
jgi:hypothetical protein